MGALIDPNVANRLAKVCGMFGSDHDGERANAARLANELVRSSGLTWGDIIAPPQARLDVSPGTPWQRMVGHCQVRRLELSAKEREFIDTLATWRRTPTEGQLAWLGAIYARLIRVGR